MSSSLTLNEAYNKELEKCAPFGHGEPECQECGCDLTGKQVYRVDNIWCCSDCQHALLEEKKNSRCRNRHDD
jgi:hypothetical protein